MGRAHSQVPLTRGRTTSTASGGRNQTCALGAGCPGECSGRGLCQQVRRLDDSDIALSPRPFLPPPRPGPLHGTPSHIIAHNNTNYRFLALVSVSLPASLRPPGALPVPVPRVGLGLRGHVEGQPVRPRVTHSLTSLPHRALSLPLPHLTRYAIPDTLPFLIHSLHTPFSARLSLSAGSLPQLPIRRVQPVRRRRRQLAIRRTPYQQNHHPQHSCCAVPQWRQRRERRGGDAGDVGDHEHVRGVPAGGRAVPARGRGASRHLDWGLLSVPLSRPLPRLVSRRLSRPLARPP